MQDSKIGWTHHTINIWWGCEKVSPACKFCYAETQAALRGFTVNGRAGTSIWGRHQPRKWGKHALKECRRLNDSAGKRGVRERVFVNSMSDFFETDHGQPIIDHLGRRMLINAGEGADGNIYHADSPVEDDWGSRPLMLTDLREQAFELFNECQNLDFILLTKRPENIREMIIGEAPSGMCLNQNVWLMTTVENQAIADERIPHLQRCRDLSPVLGLSCEPLLGPIDLQLQGFRTLDWVITGCEQQSKQNRRVMELDWVLSIDQQCQAAGVPHFHKQYYDTTGKLRTDGNLNGVVRQDFPVAERQVI